MHDVPDQDVVESVLLASRALVAVAARSLEAAPDEVTLPQFRVLVVLASRGPQSATALAAELGTALSSLTRMCDRLERKGLISRKLVAGNRRQVDITVSDGGRAVVDAVTRVRRREIARLLRAIPTERRPLIADALGELARAAGEDAEQTTPLGWGP